MNRIRSGAVIVAGLWSALSFAAARAETLPASVRACMDERDDARRLACFDRETARLFTPAAAAVPVAAASAPAPAATAAPVAAQSTEEQKFGYRGSLAREEVDRRKAEEEKLDQVTAKVVAVNALPHGQFVAKLDNGQVWQQKTIDRVRVDRKSVV